VPAKKVLQTRNSQEMDEEISREESMKPLKRPSFMLAWGQSWSSLRWQPGQGGCRPELGSPLLGQPGLQGL